MLDRFDQVTEKYLIRDPLSGYKPRLVTKKPEYRKRTLGSCSKCPKKVQDECRYRMVHRSEMPVMCEVWDSLDVLASGFDEKAKKILVKVL